ERIAHATAEWERLGRAAGALWGREQLAGTERVDTAAFHAAEAEFIERSRSAVLGARRVRWALIASVPLFAALIYAVVAFEAYRGVGMRVGEQLEIASAALADARGSAAQASALRH